MEQTRLYALLSSGQQQSYVRALKLLDSMEPAEVQLISEANGNTFLHHLVNCLEIVVKKYKQDNSENAVSPSDAIVVVIPIIYKLAILRVDVNAKNVDGNSCLHLAAFRPFGDLTLQHLIRIGIISTHLLRRDHGLSEGGSRNSERKFRKK